MRQEFLPLIGLLFLLLFAGCSQSDRQDKAVTRLLSDHSCEPLGSPCRSQAGSRVVSLFFPAAVHYLRPFEMQVVAMGFGQDEIINVTVSFTMTDMDMGINRFGLRKEETPNARLTYKGRGMIPVCVSGRRDWLATVELETENNIYTAQYRLKIESGQ